MITNVFSKEQIYLFTLHRYSLKNKIYKIRVTNNTTERESEITTDANWKGKKVKIFFFLNSFQFGLIYLLKMVHTPHTLWSNQATNDTGKFSLCNSINNANRNWFRMHSSCGKFSSFVFRYISFICTVKYLMQRHFCKLQSIYYFVARYKMAFIKKHYATMKSKLYQSKWTNLW